MKVSYEFNNFFATHSGEVIPVGSLVDMDKNNVWHAYVTAWTESKECVTLYSNTPYQKVYRLTTELTFMGAAFELPPLTSKRWEPYYYRNNRGLGFFFSVNPLKSYHIDIQVPDDVVAGPSWMDRRYWNASGHETCTLGDDAYANVSINGESVGKLQMENKPVCETSDLYVVDSYVAVNSDKGGIHEFFSWTVINGVAVLSCDATSLGRVAAPAERRAPSRR